MEPSPTPRVLTPVPPTKRQKIDVDLTVDNTSEIVAPKPSPVYYYWPKDRHSFTIGDLEPYVKTAPNPMGWIVTPNRHVDDHASVKFHWEQLPKLGTGTFVLFILDVSRTNEDTICPITLKPFAACNPHLLNFNGRSYARKALMEVADGLKSGLQMRLEDTTLHPEQLRKLVFYPNESLGAEAGQHPVKFKTEPPPIHKFDPSIELENHPEFWACINKGDKEQWNLDAAIETYNIPSKENRCDLNFTVIANQYCSKQKLCWPHPKTISHGCPIFKNCLFVECEIYCACWCGAYFHGCRFLNCTFVFWQTPNQMENHAKCCEIYNGILVVTSRVEYNQNAMALLKTHVGREVFRDVKFIPFPENDELAIAHHKALCAEYHRSSEILGAARWESKP